MNLSCDSVQLNTQYELPKFQQPNFTQQEEIENGKNPKFWGILSRLYVAKKKNRLNEEFLEFESRLKHKQEQQRN